MSGKDLARSTEHLARHRRLIIGRSIAAGVVGLAPIPLLDDWLVAVIRRRTIRRIAEDRRVDLDDAAVRAVADGRVPPPSWRSLLGSTALLAVLKRTLRKAILILSVARRVEDMARAFAVATLFDHYCARLHVGAGLDAEAGAELREAMDRAIDSTRGRLVLRLFRHGLYATGRAALRAPVEIIDIASGGTLRRLFSQKDEAAAEEIVEEAVARADGPGGLLSRATSLVETQLSAAGQAYVDELLRAFEARVPRHG